MIERDPLLHVHAFGAAGMPFDRATALVEWATAEAGPLEPLRSTERPRVAVSWGTLDGARATRKSFRSFDELAKREARRPWDRTSRVSIILWSDGDPFWDERPDMVVARFCQAPAMVGAKFEISAPELDHEAVAETTRRVVRGLGCRAGSGWVSQGPFDSPISPDWYTTQSVIADGIVDAPVAGATWLMLLRPDLPVDAVAPSAVLDNQPIVDEVATQFGIARMVRIAPSPAETTPRDLSAWEHSVAALVPVELTDHAKLMSVFSEAVRRRATRQPGSQSE